MAHSTAEQLGDGFVQNPYAVYQRLRAEGPVSRVVMPGGYPVWVVTRYADARAALADPRLIKDWRTLWPGTAAPDDGFASLDTHMLSTDPPDHDRLRRLVTKAFTARRIEQLRPRVTEITTSLLDEMPAGGQVDLLEAFAFPLPITVIPGELARLQADSSLLPGAVEELLRYTSPVNHATFRFTAEAVEIGGTLIPAREAVLVAIASANRDPDRYPAPDRLDLGRDAGGNLAFGHGIHYCLGAPLARMEGVIAFGALLSRFPGMTLAVPPDSLRWRPSTLIRGLETLPVRLS